MEERKMNEKELFDYINHQNGDFLVKVILVKEGEVSGEEVERSVYSTCRTTYDE